MFDGEMDASDVSWFVFDYVGVCVGACVLVWADECFVVRNSPLQFCASPACVDTPPALLAQKEKETKLAASFGLFETSMRGFRLLVRDTHRRKNINTHAHKTSTRTHTQQTTPTHTAEGDGSAFGDTAVEPCHYPCCSGAHT